MDTLTPRDLAVLLPRHPDTYAIVGPAGSWPAALEALGSRPGDGSAGLCVVTARGRGGATDVLLDQTGRADRDRTGTGWTTVRYAARRLGDDLTEIRPVRRGRRTIVVQGRESVVPAAVAAAGRSAVERVLVHADPRRRVALLTDDAVVKVPRDADQAERGAIEQAVLTELLHLDVRNVPRPLGHGRAGAMAWSAETRVDGAPLEGIRDARRARSLLDALAGWLATVACRTRRDERHDELPLRGPFAGAAVGDDVRVPSVLQHGDLASGLNVLVDGDGFAVVDWETARPRGWPLVDLLPLVCLGLARARGARGAESEAEAVLRLCRGEDPESEWLFGVVHAYIAAVGVPVSAVGPLAMLAWGYQASMRLVHDELVVAAGRQTVSWTSPAELVAAAWSSDRRLGPGWPALARLR